MAVAVDDAVEGRVEDVGVHRGEAAAFFGQHAQAVLRQLHFLAKHLRPVEGELRAAGARTQNLRHLRARRLDVLRRQADQAARIDGKEIHVRACGRRDGVLGRPHDIGRRMDATEHVVERIIDAFAEQQQRFAPPANGRKKIGQVLQGAHHGHRALAALDVVLRHRGARAVNVAAVTGCRIVCGIGPELALVVLVERFEHGRSVLAAHELVDGRHEQRGVCRKVLHGVGAAARVDDGADVVRAEIFFDEAARRLTDHDRANGADVQVIEHDDIHMAGEGRAVRSHIGRHRPAERRKPVLPLDGNVHEREGIDFLRFDVFENVEVVFREARNEMPLSVGDDRVDVDVIDLGLKRHRRRSGRRLRRLRGEARRRRKQGDADEDKRALHGQARV